MKSSLTLLAVFSLVLALFSPARADWVLDGTPLCHTVKGSQYYPTIISDGVGGAIVTWCDERNGIGSADIYVQRVNASGVPQWTAEGVALCISANSQVLPAIVSDGAGGAIVAWEDGRLDADIYAQRVSSSGIPQWTWNGVVVCTASNNQHAPTLISDGAGGAIIAWYDYRNGINNDIYVQRLDASGTPQWTADGVALCTAAGEQLGQTITSDGAGGAIVTWSDSRSGTNYDIYTQRVNASGVPQWTADGVPLCIAANDQSSPKIVSDDAGGAIVVWQDSRNGSYDIYAQRVSSYGYVQWTIAGVSLCLAANQQHYPTTVSDGDGGAIVTWYDSRGGTDADIYAQRVGASGASLWEADGVALCTSANDQTGPTIVSDEAGGAIVAWQDFRSGTSFDIYAQRVNAFGAPQWLYDGTVVGAAANSQVVPSIVWDGAGSAIVAWQDFRSVNYDIYAQRVEGRYGYWGHPEPTLASVSDVPGDQGGKVKVNWNASGRDELNQRVISHYSIWRATDAATVAGIQPVNLSDIGPNYKGRAVRIERGPTTDYYWELVGNVDAIYRSAYSYTAATSYDSTASGGAVHQFQVVAHAYNDQYTNWPSNVVSGHSVDNLAPAAPLMLTAQRVGADVHLKWNHAVAPDLRDYSVYRASTSGVTPVSLNFLASADDTVLVDAGAPGTALYYVVTAYDVHRNQSAPSNEASVNATTGVGSTPAITALTVLQNSPNPFTGTTTLSIGLPSASDVEIDVYDVAGQRVRVDCRGRARAGEAWTSTVTTTPDSYSRAGCTSIACTPAERR